MLRWARRDERRATFVVFVPGIVERWAQFGETASMYWLVGLQIFKALDQQADRVGKVAFGEWEVALTTTDAAGRNQTQCLKGGNVGFSAGAALASQVGKLCGTESVLEDLFRWCPGTVEAGQQLPTRRVAEEPVACRCGARATPFGCRCV